MGNESIDLSLGNIFHSWFAYRKGKKPSCDLDNFQYNLESELHGLWRDLNNDRYRHGGYRKFVVSDNKRREVSVASVKDRVVHRLIYDYLNRIYDKTFIYDAWSCRKNKGLVAAIGRTQQFLKSNSENYIWKADIKKFFDNVDHDILLKIIKLKIKDEKSIQLIREIIQSFPKGMPIGNLTSQIFANIYLNELDRFIKHKLKVKNYLRYGDDFIALDSSIEKLTIFREKTENFLNKKLKLKLHSKNDKIYKIKHGLKFLGTVIYPQGRKLNNRNTKRIQTKLNNKNLSSYWGLIQKHGNEKRIKEFHFKIIYMT